MFFEKRTSKNLNTPKNILFQKLRYLNSLNSKVLNSVLIFFFFPKRKILLKQFNDWFSISESLFINIINLLKGIGESLFTKITGLLVVVHNFVMEDREVKSKTKSDWVAGVQRLRSGLCKNVILKSSIFDLFDIIFSGALCNVSIIVTDHLVEESFGFISGCDLHTWVFDNRDDVHALIKKFLFNLFFVSSESIVEFWVFWVLLNGTDGSDCGSFATNLVFETNGKKISFFSGEVFVFGLNNFLEVVDHVVKSLSLFGNSGHENIFF